MTIKAEFHFQNHEDLQVCKTNLKMEFKPPKLLKIVLSLTINSNKGTIHVCQVRHMH